MNQKLDLFSQQEECILSKVMKEWVCYEELRKERIDIFFQILLTWKDGNGDQREHDISEA